VILTEIQYRIPINNSKYKSGVVTEKFEIIIPKINLQSQVIPDVDPFNKNEYLNALSKGVAHAKDTALPGEEGNVFIFGHSTDVPFNVARLNAVFYLINKLKPGDEIKLSYNGKGYKYIVNSTTIIGSKEVNYLQNNSKSRTLTLMTCWPPGTTFKRLLVTGLLAD
ncbi:MAG: sortase, partial [Candidatus Daviesbacteria bacterium]|nr:sortase [Candidatus Daviesbacteria bacterium]